ncbi:hypothetical protein MGSAQ_001782 [marine sediment metagenome]|uniref:Uncharacterized protein n=1 Tax=marine sediment metagenome TaxID=412755 RepID=A0A1B6NUU1_9ZZZZ
MPSNISNLSAVMRASGPATPMRLRRKAANRNAGP